MIDYLQQEQRNTVIAWLLVSLLTLCGIFLLAIAIYGLSSQRGENIYYEYETTNGEKGEAKYCGGRGKTYCLLDDGTIVVDIKQYKKMYKEDEE